MDASILAKFPDDDHVLGPFLGNLPPEVLDEVIKRLGWFKTMFALAGKTCREVVERVKMCREVVERVKTRAKLDKNIGFGVRESYYKDALIRNLISTAVEGDVEALKWLTEQFEVQWSTYRNEDSFQCMPRAAALHGNLEVLMYLHENGYPWDSFTCKEAAGGGHLELLKYLHENGCPWDRDTCAATAWDGHLEVLKYLHENGCPWDQHTCNLAAMQGQLEVLKYLHENGCPWDQHTYT